jgi:omega-6 fatty acid desaturase (delta-12 desaturase)
MPSTTKPVEKFPNAGQLRAAFPDDVRQRTVWQALVVTVPTILITSATWLATLLLPWWLWPLTVVVHGLAAGVIFVLAHDTAHDALFPSHWLNRVLAQLFFVPTWHPYTGWVHAHNHVHHGWTNYQPRDYVWAPLSLTQYQALSPLRKWFYRFCRTAPGFAAYYGYEVLWRKIWLVQPEVRRRKTRAQWLLDDLILFGLMVVQGVLGVTIARQFGVTQPAWLLVVMSQVIPAILGNWLVGFITYLHHTHASMPWFEDLTQWNFYTGQILGTAHVKFPGEVNTVIHHVMEHTAHHVDPRIPLYRLPAAQEQLNASSDVTKHKFSWNSFRYTQRTCQLYDFAEHCWTDYHGHATSSRTVSDELLARAAASRKHREVDPVTASESDAPG